MLELLPWKRLKLNPVERLIYVTKFRGGQLLLKVVGRQGAHGLVSMMQAEVV